MSMRLLLVSGSLRRASSSSALVHAAALLVEPDVEAYVFDAIDALPHFNPDLDIDPVPPSVTHWRDALRSADAVLISTPEYAHGVPGVLKNALDWVVGTGEFMYKPVGLLNASAASTYAPASLTETLSVMMAQMVPAAMVLVPLAHRHASAQTVMSDIPAVDCIRGAVRALHDVVTAAPTTATPRPQ